MDSEELDESTYERHMVYPLRITDKELDGVWHDSTVKNFSGFIRAKYSKKTGVKTFHCYSCLHRFTGAKNETSRKKCRWLQEHVKYCSARKRVSYPQEKTLEFTNIQRQLKQLFVGYADFESFLEKVSHENVATGLIDSYDPSKGIHYKKHMLLILLKLSRLFLILR